MFRRILSVGLLSALALFSAPTVALGQGALPPSVGSTQTLTLDGKDTRTNQPAAWTCGKFRVDGWPEVGQVYWRLVLGSEYGGDYTVTLPASGDHWAMIPGEVYPGAGGQRQQTRLGPSELGVYPGVGDHRPASYDMPPHRYTYAATQPDINVAGNLVTVTATLAPKEYFNVTFVATRTNRAMDPPMSIWANLDNVTCSQAPTNPMIPGNRSNQCVVDWTAAAYLDQDLPDYSNNGYTDKVSVDYFGDPGGFEMQHFVLNGDSIVWRPVIATDYAMENVVVTIKLPKGFNYVAVSITNG